MSDPFRDRTVVVTGASRGLGETFATALAERGARLVLCARSADDLARVADLAARAGPHRPVTVEADLGVPAGVEALTRAVDGLGRPVDRLVNNAGFGSGGPWHTLDIERELAMVRLNIEACLRLARHWLPGMVARRSGGVLNVASLGAFMPMPFMATYGATKAFVLSWSEALWAECRPHGVQVTALCPGPVPTNFGKAAGLPPSPDRTADMDAGTVVEEGLRAWIDGRPGVVPGLLPKLISIAPRILPRAFVAKMAAGSIGKRFEKPGPGR